MIDAITDHAIYMLDPVGVVASWSRGAQRLKGYTEAEILGEHFARFYTDADRHLEVPQRALETAARDARFEGEGWRCRKDGSLLWAHVIIDPIWNEQRELIGFAKITRDITSSKEELEILRPTAEPPSSDELGLLRKDLLAEAEAHNRFRLQVDEHLERLRRIEARRPTGSSSRRS